MYLSSVDIECSPCLQVQVKTDLQNYVNQENNCSQPSLEVIRKMALALDVTADELVFEKRERKSQMRE